MSAAPPLPTGSPPRPWAAAAVALGAGALYVASLAPTLSWGDSADLALRVFDLGDHGFGPSRQYTLYRRLGRLFLGLPLGDVAWRVNLMSACFGALTVAAVHAVVRLRTGSALAAAAAALALAFSHTLWWLSAVAEVYTLATFLLVVAFLGLLRFERSQPAAAAGWLALAGLALGLAWSHHLAAALAAPAVLAFGVAERRRLTARRLGAFAAAFAVGGALRGVELGVLLAGEGAGALAGAAAGSLNPHVAPAPGRDALLFGAQLFYQFPGPAFALGLLGAATALRGGLRLHSGAPGPSNRPFDRAVGLAFAVFAVWGIASRIPDKFNAYVFAYPFFALWIGLGTAQLLRRRPRLSRSARALLLGSLALAPPALYALAPPLSQGLGIDLVGARVCPERDNDRYFLFPPKTGDRGPRRFAESALDAVAPGGVLIADYTLWRPLRYVQQVDGRRVDVELVFVEPLLAGEGVAAFARRRSEAAPVYLAAAEPPHYYALAELARGFELVPEGPVFRLETR